jgi:hypothetical protein
MKYASILILLQLLIFSSCDDTLNSDELSGDETIYHEYTINYNQESNSLYAEAELTRQRNDGSITWFSINHSDYIKLVGTDKLQFQVTDKNDLTYVLEPTSLNMKRKSVYMWSKTVPYYRLDKDLKINNLENKVMAFSYYNSSDSRTYTYETEVLTPTLQKMELSNGDVLRTDDDDTLTLTFAENIKEFDVVNLEFVNSQGNSFFFSVNPELTTELVISSADLREQALNQSYTLKEARKKKLGNLSIETKKEKDIPLLLAGIRDYKLNITAKRKVEDEIIYADRNHEISIYQNIKVYEQNIKIGF